MKRYILGSLMLLAVFVLAACGSDNNNNNTPAFQITTVSLLGATIGTPYSQTLTATGGTGAKTWSISAGALPTWMSLTPATGLLSGTPTTAATTNFTVTVTDAATPTANSAIKALSITVTAPVALTVTTVSLLGATIGTPYSQTLTATGGTGAKTWSISAGALPTWMSLTPATGLLSGTPTTAATTNFTVTVTDAATPTANSAIKALSITVTAAALNGATLYNANCSAASCHGPLATSSKRGRTAAQIQAAINANTGGMGFLSTLTPAEVQAIATALFP